VQGLEAMDFVAIDVETANADLSSICQIGVVKYSHDVILDEWCSLVNPEDCFDLTNVMIHGISEDDVQNSPTFPEVVSVLRSFMNSSVCVSHTHFDRVSLSRACSKYDIDPFDAIWLDSARVARRAWGQFSRKGYGLASICEFIGHEFTHHDALEDAKAAGQVLLQAIAQTGTPLDEWLLRVNMPISGSRSSKPAREVNPEGPLAGEVIVFTGALSIPRRQAADLAAQAGCKVRNSVSKNVTLLVVGDQDIRRLAGHASSSKHRRAEELISKGQPIRIELSASRRVVPRE
jgi:DNA polymerase-3 subunit epsilon